MNIQDNVAVIILNWNGYKDTAECLMSLENICSNYKLDIIVVDNASRDDDYFLLKKNFSAVKSIKSETNLGFSGGNNLGLKIALEYPSKYFLLLNNDTSVEKNFLDSLLNIFKLDSKCGIVAPKINYYDNPQIIWSAGGKISKIRGSGFAKSNIKSNKLSSGNRQVDFVSGCCMLIKREVFEKIGFFDEDFFLYLEDTDFCKRTVDAGYKIFVAPQSVIYHKVGKSSINLQKPISLYYTSRNRLLFVKKHYPKYLPVTSVYLLITMIIKSFFWILSGRSKNIKAVFWAFADFISGKRGKISDNTLRKL